MPDRENTLETFFPATDRQTIEIVHGYVTDAAVAPSGSNTSISFTSSESSAVVGTNATRTFTSTTLVQDASEV